MDSCNRIKLQLCSKNENEKGDNQYNRICGRVVKITDSYTCGRCFDSYLTYIFLKLFFRLFLELYVHVNNFSVMSGRFPVFIG